MSYHFRKKNCQRLRCFLHPCPQVGHITDLSVGQKFQKKKNFGQISRFLSKTEVSNKNRYFDKKSECSRNIEIELTTKNQIFLKIDILVQSFIKNINFVENQEFDQPLGFPDLTPKLIYLERNKKIIQF